MWTYLSPHFDDAAFSCGGLIWEQVQNGEEVIILTVCAGEPPPGALTDYAQGLHARWETGQEAVALRREENKRSCQILGAEEINLTIPDVIYRRSAVDGSPICSSDEELTARLKEDEFELLDELMLDFNKTIPPDAKIVSPLALGGHVDHRLTRTAIEKLNRSIQYYADFPYLFDVVDLQLDLEREMTNMLHPVSLTGLDKWQASIEAHASQISTFWGSVAEMREAVQSYWEPVQGLRLWYFP